MRDLEDDELAGLDPLTDVGRGGAGVGLDCGLRLPVQIDSGNENGAGEQDNRDPPADGQPAPPQSQRREPPD